MVKVIKLLMNHLCILPFVGMLSCVFIINNDLENGIVTGKYIWFYLMMGGVSLATIISYLINQKSIKYSVVDLLIALFSILGIVITLLNNSIVTTKLILFVLVVLLYFFFRIILFQYKSNVYLLVIFFITTGLVEGIWGLMQLYGLTPSQHGLFNVTGSFFNPGPYAGYLAVILPMTLYYIIKDWNIVRTQFRKKNFPFHIRWIISFITLITIVLMLPATMSRASWIASIGGCIFVLIMYGLHRWNGRRVLVNYFWYHKNKVIVLSTCFILLNGFIFYGIYSMKKDSADGRALIWKISIETIKENSIGVGIGHFPGAYGKKQAEYFKTGQATLQEELIAGNPEYAFNEFIQICIEFGIIPFVLLIIMFGYVIIVGIQKKRIGAVGSLIALLIFASMSYPFNLLPFVIVQVCLIALCITSKYEITFQQDLQNSYIFDFRTRYRINRGATISLLLTLSIITVFCLYNRYPTYSAYKNWKKARMYYNTKAYKDANTMYRDLYPYLNDQAYYLFEYGQILSKISEYEKSNSILQISEKISCDPMFYNIMGKNYQSLKQFSHAEQCFLHASYIVPHRLYSYYLLSKLYVEMGAIDKAKNTAELILKKTVKVDSPAVREMKKEMEEIHKKE